MATAPMTVPRARLADDAATAALYATQSRRKTDRDATATPPVETNNLAPTGSASNLSAASAGAALAHANQKSVEPWRPGRLTTAEKAALSVKDFTPPEIPQSNSKYSPEGLGAAILAVREQKKASSQPPIRTAQKHNASDENQQKALQAATGAYISRQRSGSAPLSSLATLDSSTYDNPGLSAAGATHRNKPDDEGPLDHLNSSAEASRIRHISGTNAQLYTSAPPVSLEVDERNRQNSLRAAAISMARDMYDISASKTEQQSVDPALVAAQTGSARLQARKTISGTEGNSARRALTLQDVAQKRAAEKLARMQTGPKELQMYYGTAPQPTRSRLTTRRTRRSSDADATQVDAEQSRRIHKQMTSLRTKLNEVDEKRTKDDDKRTKDRAMLMEAARRNVDATIQGMETKMYLNTGRAPPSLQKEWDDAANERVRQEAEAASVSTGNGHGRNRINIGGQQYVDMADIEAVARSRVQPTLDDIDDQVESRKAKELEARLDAEEKARQAALEKERDASVQALGRRTSKVGRRDSKIASFMHWRRKSKVDRTNKPEAAAAEADVDASAEEAPTPVAQEEQDTGLSSKDQRAPSAAEPSTPAEKETAPEEEVLPTATEPSHESPAAETPTVRPVTPERAPIAITESTDNTRPPLEHSYTSPREVPFSSINATKRISHPITSPKADSKLKTWFRDRLPRRSSGPIQVYPHQPGPAASRSSTSIGFTGGVALTGGAAQGSRDGARSAALTSHPVTGSDLDQREPVRGSNSLEVYNTATEDAPGSRDDVPSSPSKRERFRNTFLMRGPRAPQTPVANGSTDHGRRDSDPLSTTSETKVTAADIRGLRNSAANQGLPVPPVLGETSSVGRESRFSEDLW